MDHDKVTIGAEDVGSLESIQDKPPAQTLGVSGIEAKPIELTPDRPLAAINWFMVAALPPFQMFVHEQVPAPPDRDSQRWAQEYAVRRAAQRGDQDLLDEYFAWHEKKGYWPKETPFGELKEIA